MFTYVSDDKEPRGPLKNEELTTSQERTKAYLDMGGMGTILTQKISNGR